MLKKYKKLFTKQDHCFKKQIANLFHTTENEIMFLDSTHSEFNEIIENSIKVATIDLKNQNKTSSLVLYSNNGSPLILDSTDKTSYIIVNRINLI